MVIVHPTYRVTWKIGEVTSSLRVSQPDLDAFIRAVLFNQPATLVVEYENPDTLSMRWHS